MTTSVRVRGLKRTPEQRARIAAATKAAMQRPGVRERYLASRADPALRTKLSEQKQGEKNPMYGREVSGETRAKRSTSMREHGRKNEKNPSWKGDEAKLPAIHKWLNRYYPRVGVCEHCGESKRTEYAFLRWPDEYTRDRDDYAELCRQCHVRYDFATGERTS